MSEFNINEDAQSGGECSGSQSSNKNHSSPPIESAFPDEDEETITMVDVLEREDELEDEASAVLGNSDEKNCTYPNGYIPRQALYSCATCSEGSDKLAAICLACSLECHENHELFELYTKRNYRCDCGNGKFKEDFECKFTDKQTKKPTINEKNKYNHNFLGKYCICDKRYPPDENDNSPESNDEMLQCIVCEDWYHTKHLGVINPPAKFDELICGGCVDRLGFVRYYKESERIGCSISIKGHESERTISTGLSSESQSIKKEALDTIPEDPSHRSLADESRGSSSTACMKSFDSQSTPVVGESDTNDSQLENKDPSTLDPIQGTDENPSLIPTTCRLDELKKKVDHIEQQFTGSPKEASQAGPSEPSKSAIFWSNCSWRSKLCRCSECLSMYRKKGCEYLLDEKDTVQYYEAQGRALSKDRGTPFERGMSALNRMNRTAVVEALHGYDELKADLSSYLRKFADTKKVVREEDIRDFFAQLKSKKRPKLEYE